MKTMQFLILITAVAFFAGCATVPKELVNARWAYLQASTGPAAQLVPAELHQAQEALNLAEQSFRKDSNSYKTRDLAYVAERKSELAGALGVMAADKARTANANTYFQKKQTEIVAQGKQDLKDSEARTAEVAAQGKRDLKDSEARTAEVAAQGKQDLKNSEARTAEVAAQGKRDLSDSEKRTSDALDALVKFVAVREEERGLVITLSGNILFRSAESTLLPSAKVKLDRVAEALLAIPARRLTIEGHTDSQGSDRDNLNLSQGRADAVRNYLIERSYPADRIQSYGLGEGSPIASNASAEGRANNRRVEIVIERDLHVSNQ
ncbi:MAG: OmpA family protein [bacterium]|nr:OmpA family protein [bacterium]